jgi:hypothetical protein
VFLDWKNCVIPIFMWFGWTIKKLKKFRLVHRKPLSFFASFLSDQRTHYATFSIHGEQSVASGADVRLVRSAIRRTISGRRSWAGHITTYRWCDPDVFGTDQDSRDWQCRTPLVDSSTGVKALWVLGLVAFGSAIVGESGRTYGWHIGTCNDAPWCGLESVVAPNSRGLIWAASYLHGWLAAYRSALAARC